MQGQARSPTWAGNTYMVTREVRPAGSEPRGVLEAEIQGEGALNRAYKQGGHHKRGQAHSDQAGKGQIRVVAVGIEKVGER